MIRTDSEYRYALARVEEERLRLAEYVEQWRAKGYSKEAVANLSEPMECFHLQLVEEVQSYERLKDGRFAELENLSGLGQLLVGLRIARGLSQRELAARLGVHESQVSRDERNEYHGITLDRAQKILDTLNADLRSTVELRHPPSANAA